ncbi:hypothetical protein ACFY1B_44860 [Streptomyces mirabilis]|uniref:hypothetical protein n=1 Tax=Streptomyces mirabilis TaxID=68239 RepID=UPI0036B849E5
MGHFDAGGAAPVDDRPADDPAVDRPRRSGGGRQVLDERAGRGVVVPLLGDVSKEAVVLAKSLRDAPDTESALSLYEALRRPRVEHNITTSGKISRGFRTPSRTGRGAPAPRPGDSDVLRHLEWDIDISTVTEGSSSVAAAGEGGRDTR